MQRHKAVIDATKEKQTPRITLLTCSDSRVPERIIAEDTNNLVFTVMNIGNQAATSLGSIDYGIIHLKTPLLIVMGHTGCGAVKAALGDYSGEGTDIRKELDSLKSVLTKKTLPEAEIENVEKQVGFLRKRYAGKDVKIVGAMYDLTGALGQGAGKIHFLG